MKKLSNFQEFQIHSSALKSTRGGASCTADCGGGVSISVSDVYGCVTSVNNGVKSISYWQYSMSLEQVKSCPIK